MHESKAKGLPTAADYAPEQIGQATLAAGEPEQTWPQFGLELVPVLMDGYDTGRRMVRRNGDYVADVSDDYKLLPNERLVGVSNDVADDLGAGPFHEYDGDWFVQLDDHVFQNPERTRVHAVYAWDDGDVGGDEMSYGFGVHNSIDGSQTFSVGLFTFRHACANMVFMGAGGVNEDRALRVEDEREVVSRTTHQHTKGLAVEREELEAVIKGTLTLVDDVHETYKEWVSDRLTGEDVIDLLKQPSIAQDDLPDWIAGLASEKDNSVLDVIEHATENETDEDEDLSFERQAEIAEARIPQGTTVWETYNDLTAAIWKSGSSGDQTRRRKMKQLHRVFDPVEAGETDATVR